MTVGQAMSVERTRQVIEPYVRSGHSDLGPMAPDVVFRIMTTGQEHRTPDGVRAMLDYFYHGAFEATAEIRQIIVGEGHAALEAMFVGRHIGEFAGAPATDKDVRVPLAVFYDLRDDMIVEGRVYFDVSAFLAQVGAAG